MSAILVKKGVFLGQNILGKKGSDLSHSVIIFGQKGENQWQRFKKKKRKKRGQFCTQNVFLREVRVPGL